MPAALAYTASLAISSMLLLSAGLQEKSATNGAKVAPSSPLKDLTILEMSPLGPQSKADRLQPAARITSEVALPMAPVGGRETDQNPEMRQSQEVTKQGYTLDHLEHPCPSPRETTMPSSSSCFVLGATSSFRRAVHRLVCWPWFDRVVLLMIIASSILIAAEDPANPSARRNQILNYFDFVFLAFFVTVRLHLFIDHSQAEKRRL